MTSALDFKARVYCSLAQISRSEEFHFGGSSGGMLHINHAWEPHVNLDSFTVNAAC